MLQVFFDPKEKFGFVVITNGTNEDYTDGFNDVIKSSINILYENLIK